MELTKDQRFTAYCIMLAEIETNLEKRGWGGFCSLISDIFNIELCNVMEFGYPTFKETFSELHLKITRNEFESSYLFNDWGERIKALKQCIQETAID